MDGMTWGKLAIKLGVSTRTLQDWRKLGDAPDRPDLERWAAYIELMDLGSAGNRVSATREQLLKENLEKKNRLLDLQIAKEERTVVDREEVNSLFLHITTLAKTILYPAMERELPPRAEGRSATEISLIGREIADRICDQMARDMEGWAET